MHVPSPPFIKAREFATEYCATADTPCINGVKRLNRRLHVLASNEIPLDFNPKNKVKLPRFSMRIKRTVEAANRDEVKVMKNFDTVGDCFTSRAFKEYIIKNNVEDFVGLEHIPTLSQRPNSLLETMELVNNPEISESTSANSTFVAD